MCYKENQVSQRVLQLTWHECICIASIRQFDYDFLNHTVTSGQIAVLLDKPARSSSIDVWPSGQKALVDVNMYRLPLRQLA